MSHRQLNTYSFICDKCKKVIIVHQETASLPARWSFSFNTPEDQLAGQMYTSGRDEYCGECTEIRRGL
jgi:hypothetical protein